MKNLRVKNLRVIIILLGIMGAIFSQVSWADEEKPEKKEEIKQLETEAEKDKVYMKLGTIVVTAKAGYLSTADIPTSVDVIGSDQLETENSDFSMEIMKKVPGTYFGDWNSGIHEGTFSIRGFDFNQKTWVALIVDGIPYNRANGDLNMDPFFPMEIERIELVKGTNDPRYGLNNVAGNLNLYTKRGGNYTQAKLLYGSFNTYEGTGLISREKNGFSQTYFVGYRTTDGYRDHSDMEKGAVSGKWFYTPSDGRLSLGLIARHFKIDADSPGYLSKEQAEADPEQMQSFARTDGGEKEDNHVSLHFDYSLTDQLVWSVKTYWQEMEKTRFCRWSPTGPQQERITNDDQFGALSTLSFETNNWGVKNLKLDWGLDYQKTDAIHQRFNATDRVRGDYRKDPTGDNWDWDYTSWYWGSYLKADAVLLDWVRLIAGMRMDRFDGDFENKQSGEKYDMIDFGTIWQPKVGLVITPYSGYNIYGNWGRSFQIPAENKRFGEEYGRDIDYSKNDGWEAGLKISPVKQLAFRICYWEQTATDEVKYISGKGITGVVDNVGETERRGWDAVLSAKPFEWATIWGSYSWQEGEYKEAGIAENIKGKNIELVPDYTAKLGIDLDFPWGFSSRVWWESQGDYYIDAENKKPKDGGYDLVNLLLSYTTMDKKTSFSFEVKNLFDEDYNGFIWDSKYGYSPGDERSFYGSVTFRF